MKITNITGNDNKFSIKLDHFVNLNPNGNFFQTLKAFDFYKSVENHEPYLIIAHEEDVIIGSLLAVFMKEKGIIKGYFSRRCVVEGWPIITRNKKEVAKMLLDEFNKVASKKAIYSEFRNFSDTSYLNSIFSDLGWNFEEHLNIIIDLSKTEETLWREVHSKRRNEIRRAVREGTKFGVINSKEEFKNTYTILKEVYQRAKLPLPPKKFFEIAYDKLSAEHFKVFVALFNGEIIGTMYTFCYKDTIYDWYAGSYKEYYKKYPNDLIPWQVFLWGKENEYKKFDFGGAGKPGIPYGVRDYKKKFGGTMENFGRYKKIHKPILYKIGELGLKILSKL